MQFEVVMEAQNVNVQSNVQTSDERSPGAMVYNSTLVHSPRTPRPEVQNFWRGSYELTPVQIASSRSSLSCTIMKLWVQDVSNRTSRHGVSSPQWASWLLSKIENILVLQDMIARLRILE
jgi:hypothetical protein